MAISNHPNNSCQCCAAPTDFAIPLPEANRVIARRFDSALDPVHLFEAAISGTPKSFGVRNDGGILPVLLHQQSPPDVRVTHTLANGVRTMTALQFLTTIPRSIRVADDNSFIVSQTEPGEGTVVTKYGSDFLEVWSTSLADFFTQDDPQTLSVDPDDGSIYLASPEELHKLDSEGSPVWSAPSRFYINVSVGTDAVFAAGRDSIGTYFIFAFDKEDGTELWDVETGDFQSGAGAHLAAMPDGNVIASVPVNTELMKLDVSDGSEIWSESVASAWKLTAHPSGDLYHLVIGSTVRRVVRRDGDDGSLIDQTDQQPSGVTFREIGFDGDDVIGLFAGTPLRTVFD